MWVPLGVYLSVGVSVCNCGCVLGVSGWVCLGVCLRVYW